MTHRERLISDGLLMPMSEETEYKRKGLLLRLREGEKIENSPIYCVFRKDDPFRHIILEGDKECQIAELIEEKLTSYEAHVLCDRLNFHDAEQPRAKPFLLPVGMYGICTMTDWDDWKARHAQMKLEV